MNGKGLFRFCFVILAIVIIPSGIAYYFFPTKSSLASLSSSQKVDLQSITFSLPAKHLNAYSLLKNDYQPDQILRVTLPGKLFEPAQVFYPISRSETNLSTPTQSMVSHFSANKDGNEDWIASTWVPDERGYIHSEFNRVSEQPIHKGKTLGQLSIQIFQQYSHISIKCVVYYKDYAFVVMQYQPNGGTYAICFKKIANTWLATNHFVSTYIDQIKAGNKDLTYSIVESTVSWNDTIEVKK